MIHGPDIKVRFIKHIFKNDFSDFAMPPPPPSLHTLSEEELKLFEGNTRQAIENRLVILRNVQV